MVLLLLLSSLLLSKTLADSCDLSDFTTIVYVDTTGTDGGDCSASSPCATFDYAQAQFTTNESLALVIGENTLANTSTPMTDSKSYSIFGQNVDSSILGFDIGTSIAFNGVLGVQLCNLTLQFISPGANLANIASATPSPFAMNNVNIVNETTSGSCCEPFIEEWGLDNTMEINSVTINNMNKFYLFSASDKIWASFNDISITDSTFISMSIFSFNENVCFVFFFFVRFCLAAHTVLIAHVSFFCLAIQNCEKKRMFLFFCNCFTISKTSLFFFTLFSFFFFMICLSVQQVHCFMSPKRLLIQSKIDSLAAGKTYQFCQHCMHVFIGYI